MLAGPELIGSSLSGVSFAIVCCGSVGAYKTKTTSGGGADKKTGTPPQDRPLAKLKIHTGNLPISKA